jgi:hypothetical protein
MSLREALIRFAAKIYRSPVESRELAEAPRVGVKYLMLTVFLLSGAVLLGKSMPGHVNDGHVNEGGTSDSH